VGEGVMLQPVLHSRRARMTAFGSASITRSGVDAGPEGSRRPTHILHRIEREAEAPSKLRLS
jgi:hypothetical protein